MPRNDSKLRNQGNHLLPYFFKIILKKIMKENGLIKLGILSKRNQYLTNVNDMVLLTKTKKKKDYE